jgi:hypothetical protein
VSETHSEFKTNQSGSRTSSLSDHGPCQIWVPSYQRLIILHTDRHVHRRQRRASIQASLIHLKNLQSKRWAELGWVGGLG